MIWLIDLLLTAGFAVLVFGVWFVYGPGWACIIAGALLLMVGVVAALRLPAGD